MQPREVNVSEFNAHDVAERARLISHNRYVEIIDHDPSLLHKAKGMLERGVAENGGTMGQRLWLIIMLHGDWRDIRERIIRDDEDGRLLRSNSPFSELIGIHDQDERTEIWRRAKAELSAQTTSIEQFAA
jgi:hypothetical protein